MLETRGRALDHLGPQRLNCREFAETNEKLENSQLILSDALAIPSQQFSRTPFLFYNSFRYRIKIIGCQSIFTT